MDDYLFRNIPNPARRRRLLLQHAAHVAQQVADAAREHEEAARAAGVDLDPAMLNRAAQLRKVIQAVAEIEEPLPKPKHPARSTQRTGDPPR